MASSEFQQPQNHPQHRPTKPITNRRSYWGRCNKRDFYPEPSFTNLETYKSAITQTIPRLRDRLFSGRTTDDTDELIKLRQESENPLKKCLSWWDLIWLGFGSIVGSGIFSLTGQEAHNHGGPAITLSYGLSGISALLSAFCYAEFAVEVPVAGGSFSFLRIELGDLVAFIAASNILLEAVVGAAGLGRAWSSYLGSMIGDGNSNYFRFRVNSFRDGFNLIDPVAVGILLIANGIAMTGTKGASVLNWVSSIMSSCVIVLVIIVGFLHGKKRNLIPFFPYGVDGVFKAAAVVYWSYTGFDMVATMAEETKKPGRDIPIGLVGSMCGITVVYCLMSLSLTMMQKYNEIDVNAGYSVVFRKIGMGNWLSYLVSICALKGMTTSLLVGSLGQSRYTTQIARAHMIPPWFALVHPKTGTPINATLLTTVTSGVVALFSSLDVLSSVMSFSTLFIFMLMAVALLVRRYCVKKKEEEDSSSSSRLLKFLGCLGAVVAGSVGMSGFWNSGYKGWVGYGGCGVMWFVGTLGMQMLPKVREPKVWGVPMVPWLPCLSIAMNLFLIGSLGYEAFVRFFVFSAVMLVYYVLVGLHATYDFAHQQEEEEEEGKEVVEEDGAGLTEMT